MQNYDIVVIGGGPCGIATVVEAKKGGLLRILLLEKGDNHSQTIRKFYKDGKRVDKEYKGLDSNTKGNIEFFDGTKESTLNYFDKLLRLLIKWENKNFSCNLFTKTTRRRKI